MNPSIADQLRLSLGNYLPLLLGAIAILLVGLVLALLVKAGIRKALTLLRLDERLNQQTATPIQFSAIAAATGFWFIILLTLLAMFSTLRFDALYLPFSSLASEVMLYLPRIFLAGVLALIAWVLAIVLKLAINKLTAATLLDEKLSESAGVRPIGLILGDVVFWLVLLLFLPAIVSALQIEGLTAPLTDLTQRFTATLPNIFAAAVIGFAGWLLAKVLRGLTTNLLAAAGADGLGLRLGLPADIRVSRLVGTLVFIFVIIPTIIAALDALRIAAISDPAVGMLAQFMAAVPNIFAAALILLVAWLVGRAVSSLLARLLDNLGFDRLPERLGLRVCTDAQDGCHRYRPSELAGRLAWFFILLFASVEAANRLDFTGVRDLLVVFIDFGADVLLGSVILIVGYWLAELVARAIVQANAQNVVPARIARIAILALVLAMGLRAMGIADDIINLGFGLILGAVAVAIALAFGLGGREAAGKLAQRWVDKYLGGKD
ncbi:hypothetical protein D8I35_17985 [Corticibacter populi]|uniref:Small-conductance mechanosensitive channel n=1 Tax=Corticibacter populi TaxID=1550736 RepID=A0A3M6QJ52_9BURK|nr:mechanosensitive ion channel [Corticibacter populi]RMX03057.1 hypothetical protein D8I35_17985 [Corticibacter populi]RZS33496.1 putative transporter (transmembrane protein) [Corticibacter populi]